jgi:hypothetical protein
MFIMLLQILSVAVLISYGLFLIYNVVASFAQLAAARSSSQSFTVYHPAARWILGALFVGLGVWLSIFYGWW